jgi:hypothetical protein
LNFPDLFFKTPCQFTPCHRTAVCCSSGSSALLQQSRQSLSTWSIALLKVNCWYQQLVQGQVWERIERPHRACWLEELLLASVIEGKLAKPPKPVPAPVESVCLLYQRPLEPLVWLSSS